MSDWRRAFDMSYTFWPIETWYVTWLFTLVGKVVKNPSKHCQAEQRRLLLPFRNHSALCELKALPLPA